MRIPYPELVNCPHCGAVNPVVDDRCQSCGRALAVYIGPAESFTRRMGLGSLMLLIALVGLCLGLTRDVPGVGAVLLLFFVPALLRTVQWVGQRRADGRPMVLAEKAEAFLMSVSAVFLIAFIFLATFAICFAAGAVLGAGASWLLSGGRPSGQLTGWWAIWTGVPVATIMAYLSARAALRLLWPIPD